MVDGQLLFIRNNTGEDSEDKNNGSHFDKIKDGKGALFVAVEGEWVTLMENDGK